MSYTYRIVEGSYRLIEEYDNFTGIVLTWPMASLRKNWKTNRSRKRTREWTEMNHSELLL
jgi:hypothetical protein